MRIDLEKIAKSKSIPLTKGMVPQIKLKSPTTKLSPVRAISGKELLRRQKRLKPKKISEMSFYEMASEKIAKRSKLQGVEAKGTPKKVREIYKAMKKDPKAREWSREEGYYSPKGSMAAAAWSAYRKSKKAGDYEMTSYTEQTIAKVAKRSEEDSGGSKKYRTLPPSFIANIKKKKSEKKDSEKKADYLPSEVLEKIGASPDLVDVAKSLEQQSEAASRATMLGYWDRLARAAAAAQIYASPQAQRQMMIERGGAGAVTGAGLGALVGAGLRGTKGALVGGGVGAVGGAGVGAYLGRRKSVKARELLAQPEAQHALLSSLAKSIQTGKSVQLM